MFDTTHLDKIDSRANILFHHVLLWQGHVVGTWTSEVKKNAVALAPKPFAGLDEVAGQAFTTVASRLPPFWECRWRWYPVNRCQQASIVL